MRPAPRPQGGGRARPSTLSRPAPARFGALLGLLLAVLAALLLPRLSAPPLTRAEIYFMDAARAMVESGDWLVPRYQGEPFFDKPILSYWLMAGAMRLFGPTAAAARLAGVVPALALVAATAWLGALLFDRRSALRGALVLATTIAFLSFARLAMSDMLLAALTTLAVALGIRAYRPPGAPWALPALGAALGLGFATKGPIALLIAGIPLGLLAVRERRLPEGPGRVAVGVLVAAVLGLGWFAVLYARLGPEPLAWFFLRENLARFAGETYDVGRPPWFYLPVYLAEGLPWSPFLPFALWRLVRSAEDRRASLLLAGWVALLLVALSLSRGKLDYYLLPAYPALSLLVGRYFGARDFSPLHRSWARLVLVGSIAAAVLALAHPPQLPEAWLPAHASLLQVAGPAGATLLLLAAALRPRPGRVMAVLAGVSAAGFGVLSLCYLPAFAAAQPNRAIAEDVARERRHVPEARLVYCDDPTQARRDVLLRARHTGIEQCDLWSLAASRDPYLFLLTPAQQASLRVLPRYRHVASYRALPASVLTLHGLLAGPRVEEVALIANYATDDPVAARKAKREYRRGIHREWQERAERVDRERALQQAGGEAPAQEAEPAPEDEAAPPAQP